MKWKRFLSCLLALSVVLAVSAQDLKPVKDKQTKKFGYQAKDKIWVIPPQFDGAKRFVDGYAEVEMDGLKGLIDANGDWVLEAAYDRIDKFDKNGLCELMRKEGKTRLHGVADRSGRIVIPVECRSVNVPRKGGSYLRTLAVAPYVDYVQDGLIVFERLGIALLAPDSGFPSRPEYDRSGAGYRERYGTTYRTVKLPGAQPLPHTISAFEQATTGGFGERRFGGRREWDF